MTSQPGDTVTIRHERHNLLTNGWIVF